MNSNETPAPFDPIFDAFLFEMIEFLPIDVIETISTADAQRILQGMPAGKGRAALRDAFRDNIDGTFH